MSGTVSGTSINQIPDRKNRTAGTETCYSAAGLRTTVPFSQNTDRSGTGNKEPLKEGQKFGSYQVIRRFPASPGSHNYLVSPLHAEGETGRFQWYSLKLYPASEKDPIRELQAHLPENMEDFAPLYADFCDDIPGYAGYFTKYVELPSLNSLIAAKAPMEEHKALYVIYTIVCHLEKALPVCGWHGRLKPSKILFSWKKQPKILGFGLTDWLRRNTPEILPQETHYYSSPEYLAGEKYNFRSDIYSLGIIFFRLLTGVLPFYSPEDSEVIAMQQKETLPQTCDRNPVIRVSGPASEILQCMTMKDPGKRYQTFSRLAEALVKADRALPDELKS